MAAVWRSQCAFARIFGGKTKQILNNSTDSGVKLIAASQSLSGSRRSYSNYAHSPFVEKVKEQYDFEIVKNPAEWDYVQRLLPFETIPDVTPKESYPSGWISPKEEAKDLPFFIPRTKNHMLPIYLKTINRGTTKSTLIRKIEGDIWLMNDEIRAYLKEMNNKFIQTRVHELARFIEIKGDYVDDASKWAYSKGF
ncbi:probable 39S ribosomal protein L49, mitochondrial [Plutella xylostella]|uniref:probable 39S ribosomal protein L49, mitochondrial n=1 Tax=Plutella xylostella TaxID=51655 RepID=UPI002033076F|nr:probable 39S ribosomal protein L49, mitochondrial [Plutella xylostella]